MLIQMTGLLASLSSITQPKEMSIAKTRPNKSIHQSLARSDNNLSPRPWRSIAFMRYSMPFLRLSLSTLDPSEVTILSTSFVVTFEDLLRPKVGTQRPRKGLLGMM